MMTWAYHTFGSWVDHLMLGVLPWYVWVFIGIAAAFAIILLLPAALDVWNPRARDWLAATALVVCLGIGFRAQGYGEGEAFKDAEWQGRAAIEQKRLDDAMARVTQAESTRDTLAQQLNDRLDKEAADAEASATQALDANGNTVAACSLPPAVARGLQHIGQ